MSQTQHHSQHSAPTHGRPKTNNARRHERKSSKTLMRRAVKEPGLSLKRQIRVTGQVNGQLIDVVSHNPLGSRLQPRQSLARSVPKSRFITHFSKVTATDRSSYVAVPAAPAALTVSFAPLPENLTPQSLTHRPASTTEAILERALREAASHEQPPLPLKGRRRARLRHFFSA